MINYGDIDSKQKNIIMIGLTLSVLLAALDSTIVSTAMKKISDDLNGINLYTWPLTIYMLLSTIVTPITGKLADTFGRKLFFMIGAITFLVGSALCGVSQSMFQLIIFRGIQGLGGGILMANTFAMIGDIFPPAERAKNTGIVFSAFGLASVIGPVLGGTITDNFSWRWVFYINIPVGMVFITLILSAVPKINKSDVERKVDYIGTITLIAALIPMLLAFTWAGNKYSWRSETIICMFIFSIIAFVIFGFIESKAEEPLISLNLFKDKIFCISAACVFLSNAAMFGAVLFIPLYEQAIFGTSSTNSGAVMTPMMIAFVIASFISGQIISKTGKLKFFGVTGFIILATGAFILTRLDAASKSAEVVIGMIILGLGIGLNMPVFTLAVQNTFPQSEIGVVTAAIQFFRNIGGTIASAIFGSIIISSINNNINKIRVGNLSSINHGFSKILSNTQTLTNVSNIIKLKKQISPAYVSDFNKFLVSLKDILTVSIHNVFVASFVISIAATAVSLLLPSLTIRKENEI